jgi:hypothetical protein
MDSMITPDIPEDIDGPLRVPRNAKNLPVAIPYIDVDVVFTAGGQRNIHGSIVRVYQQPCLPPPHFWRFTVENTQIKNN